MLEKTIPAIQFIEDIIQRFGPRPAGTDAEKNAQEYLAQKLREITPHTRFLPFTEHLDARFGKLKYYSAIYVLCLLLYWWQPWVAVVVSGISLFFLLADMMMYRDVLTNFPGKLQTSSNVDAVLEPQKEVRSTIILSGHMDSTLEYTWWYKLGHFGIILTVIAGVVIALQFAFLLLHAFQPSDAHLYVWAVFVALTPVLIVYWNMHGKDAVEGAQDNLSGVSIAYHVFKHFANANEPGKSGLQHTRLRMISFGSEEKGLCGSRAYAKEHLNQLKAENAYLINIDGVRLVKEIAVVKNELMNGTTHHPLLISKIKTAFNQINQPAKEVTVPIGGTDAVSFARKGIPSVTIVGMSASEYDFTYHTRHDKVENIEPESILQVQKALELVIEQWDKEA